MYKLSFYVPEPHLEPVKNALFAKGAGHYKAYDQCCWQVRGEGHKGLWRIAGRTLGKLINWKRWLSTRWK